MWHFHEGNGMSRKEIFVSLALMAGLIAGTAFAQTAAPGSSLAPEKMMAKEKAVEEHAEKRRACKKQSKDAGLNIVTRRKFVRDCMATK